MKRVMGDNRVRKYGDLSSTVGVKRVGRKRKQLR